MRLKRVVMEGILLALGSLQPLRKVRSLPPLLPALTQKRLGGSVVKGPTLDFDS